MPHLIPYPDNGLGPEIPPPTGSFLISVDFATSASWADRAGSGGSGSAIPSGTVSSSAQVIQNLIGSNIISGSSQVTMSWANDSVTASYVLLAQSASYAGLTAPITLPYSAIITPPNAPGSNQLYRIIATGSFTLNTSSVSNDGDPQTFWITAATNSNSSSITVTLGTGITIPSNSVLISPMPIPTGSMYILKMFRDSVEHNGQWNLVSWIGGY